MLNISNNSHFYGELTLNKSSLIESSSNPIEDKVNWLFVRIENHLYSFVYKIENPLIAQYGIPFKISMKFTMYEAVKAIVTYNHSYEVFRGNEFIGSVIILRK